jgi:1,4-dihydroxy-2-naphthoate octaprenyltransferase
MGPGFLSAQIMAINNLRDRSTDKKEKKITLAVLLNEKGARLLPLLFLSFAIALAVVLAGPRALVLLIFVFIFKNSWKRIAVAPIDSALNLSLAHTGKFLALYCFTLAGLLLWPSLS